MISVDPGFSSANVVDQVLASACRGVGAVDPEPDLGSLDGRAPGVAGWLGSRTSSVAASGEGEQDEAAASRLQRTTRHVMGSPVRDGAGRRRLGVRSDCNGGAEVVRRPPADRTARGRRRRSARRRRRARDPDLRSSAITGMVRARSSSARVASRSGPSSRSAGPLSTISPRLSVLTTGRERDAQSPPERRPGRPSAPPPGSAPRCGAAARARAERSPGSP